MHRYQTQSRMEHYVNLLLKARDPLLRCQAASKNLGSDVCFYARTLLLFTGDQILDTVIPGTAFGLLAALSGPTLDLPAQSFTSIAQRIPQVSFWLWLVILQFCVQNQRSEDSVQEDSVNKPWRPIPSGRMTSEKAEVLLKATHVAACALSYKLNVLPIFLVYICLITAYNDYGGGNKSGIIRNLFCGAGFSCYFSGALSIAVGSDVSLSSAAWKWTAIIAFGILSTTIQTQEFRDEAGDKARGRRTLVTELGRKVALWTVFITVAFWSLYTPLGFFGGGWKTAVLPVLFGGFLLATAIKAYRNGNSKLDRKLYKIWCLWMFGFCPLPLLAHIFA
ncbi:hypothetical protein EKO04_001786 [Ascochyta lentis]|uniref:Uncharacterized protein n=1 Tax=Ascochyta lentis TaxID=205686 RepID=A0A8H7JCL7_9PLEO|nr:hypothetical protein EKO04_001786 [Ascochyta lentis]